MGKYDTLRENTLQQTQLYTWYLSVRKSEDKFLVKGFNNTLKGKLMTDNKFMAVRYCRSSKLGY